MLKNKKVISMVSALCAFAFVGGVAAVNADAETATLEGFTCAGASVNAEEVGVRFVFNLEGEATAKQNAEAGVVYMPYDLYTGNTADFTIETATAATVGFGWEANEATEAEGDLVGYSYLAAESIPANMYNRVLLVRGYIADGENVYYTAPVKASMAYSAWKTIEVLPEYEETLKAYMGPYTLTSDAGNVENLYYGDVVTGLPTAKGGKNIAKWFWDAEKTNEIQPTDYATGSMNIYYELEKFAVSGVVSGASNLETVKIYANGAEVGAVAANGEYTIWLEAGNYELTFANEDYVAYANVEVAAAVSQDVALVANTWDIGNYENTLTDGMVDYPVQYTKTDVLDGSFTISGRQYNAYFPNTATKNAFTYTAQWSVSGNRDQYAPMIAITDGANRLAIGCYNWDGEVLISIGAGVGMQCTTLLWNPGKVQYNGTMQFVRTADKIEFYLNSVLTVSFTKDGWTTPLANRGYGDTVTGEGMNILKSFFGEDVELAVGVAALRNWTASWKTMTTSYTLSMNEYATVSGKVSAPEGATVDFANTTLKVGGVPCDMTIDAEGNFTAYVPAGTSTFEFKNGTWGATVADVAVSLEGTNTVNATLADYKWAVGTFGGVNCTDGYTVGATPNVVTMSGASKGVLFPNTATTGNFTYEVQVNVSSRAADDKGAGIAISDGHHFVGFTFYKYDCMLVNMGTAFGANAHHILVVGGQNDNFAVKIVKTSTSIELYVKGALKLTLNSDGTMAHSLSSPAWWAGDTFTSYWSNWGKNFFKENKSYCGGIFNGMNGACTATYTCSFTNN